MARPWRVTVAFVATVLAVGQIHDAHAVVLQEATLRRNPISKVIGMLESMEKKVKQEADEKHRVYDKYMCYCKQTGESLISQLAEAAKSLPQLRSRKQEVSALQASLEVEIEQHKKDREDAQSALSSAAEIRKKEADTFLKDSQNQQESLNSLTEAIRALQKNQEVAFLQSSSASILRRLSLSADMTTTNRDLLSSFLSARGGPSSQILGMLKQMKEDMGSDLKEMKDSEQQRLAEHLSLMEAKRKQQQVAMKAMEEKMLRLGELKVEMQVLKDDLKDQAEAQKENQQFATDLNKTCEDKEQAWSEYQALQAQELEALSETVEFLSKDQVRDAVGDATKGAETARTPSFGNLRAIASEWKAWSFLQTEADEAEATGDVVELALRGQKRGMDDVVSRIDDLHEVLDKEQESDEERHRYCETKLREANAAKSNKEREFEDATSILATFQNEHDTVLGEIKTLEEHMKELDAQVAKTTAARQAERAAFEKSRDTNNAALELLEVAEKRLQRFYATSSSLAETGATQARIRRDPQAPKADLSYQKQGQGFKVLQLFTTIKADVQKQTQMLQSQDAVGQSEYENLVKNSNQKKMADNRSLGSKQAAKAELEADIQRSREELRSLNQVLGALREEIRSLHSQCDFLLKNFDLREDARRAERRSLTRAKSILEAN
ncbi:unnamed protein product [Durusdinium trenchii]|uniref:Uncharacterized protein n=2 Tax=Durusdinium trenchii TaxID=1381693 RepID=A0ABP0R5Y9_9DINO